MEFHKKYESELEKVEKEKAGRQAEKDRAAAYVLQEEEIDNLGVTLKSPTEHQRKLSLFYVWSETM